MTIPKITPYTGGVANPDGSQTQTEFTQNMFDQLSYEATLATELNDTVEGINDTSTEIDAAVVEVRAGVETVNNAASVIDDAEQAAINANSAADTANQTIDYFESTVNAQFQYGYVGNISDYAGQSLPETDKLNAYQYPDDSDKWYGPIQNQSFPITIPSDPSAPGSGWALVNALTSDSLSVYTDIVYKASSGKSAVENMIAGIPLSIDVGKYCQCENGTIFTRLGNANGDISDFKPINPPDSIDFGVSGDGVTDDTTAIQSFFNIVRDEGYTSFKLHGVFLLSSEIVIEGNNILDYVDCNAEFRAADGVTMGNMVTMRNCQFCNWEGKLEFQGNGTFTYGTKLVMTGLKLEGSGRMTFGSMVFRWFWLYGLDTTSDSGNNTLCNFGDVSVRDCGVFTNDNSQGRAAPFVWSNRIDAGSSGSPSQTTTITVDNLQPGVVTDSNVYINGEVYTINSVDSVASTITTSGWIDLDLTGGTGHYIIGAGIKTEGGDSGILGFNGIDAVRCGRALWSDALYGVQAKRVVTQFNFIGYQVGGRREGAFVTEQISGLYTEGNIHDIYIAGTTTGQGVSIESTYALNYDKVSRFAPRTIGNLISPSFEGLYGITIRDANQPRVSVNLPRNFSASTTILDWNEYDTIHGIDLIKGSTTNLTLVYDDNLNRLFGYSKHKVYITRNSDADLGTINVSIDPDNGADGWTIQGSPTYTINPSSPIVEVIFISDVTNKNWLVGVNNMSRS